MREILSGFKQEAIEFPAYSFMDFRHPPLFQTKSANSHANAASCRGIDHRRSDGCDDANCQ